jgi:hypothetical protein
MKRIDSGFHESFLSGVPHNGSTPFLRCNTAPNRQRDPKKFTVDSVSPVKPTGMESQRPTSEKRSRPAHQRSKTSSSETSRSRGHGHGSKPSSRRTSCTIVDPSRSRHYRMQSSNTVSSATRQDIDDVYALHHRSYTMFQNPSVHTGSGLPSPALSHAEQHAFASPLARFSVDESNTIDHDVMAKQSEGTVAAADRTMTTMHWTSPCSRRRDYDRIDKANSGFRGFLNKVMPRCVSGPQEKFYVKDQDQSDACSVRRYRIEDEEENDKDMAKSKSTAEKPSAAKKKWTCF